MYTGFQKNMSVVVLVCLGMMFYAATSSSSTPPTLSIVVNPSKTTVYAGTEPLVLTAQTSGADLVYRWVLKGPGKLDNTDLPAVFYMVPETIEGQSAQAVITVTATDKTGQAVTESITFKILPGEQKAAVSELPSKPKKGMSSTTKITLGVAAVAALGGGIALASSSKEDTSSIDYLGRVWNETESEGKWKGIWTRREDSNIFDAVWTWVGSEPYNHPQATAVLTITIEKDYSVFVARRQANRSGDCDYTGTLDPNRMMVSGTYRCPDVGEMLFAWEAEITGAK